MQKKQKEKYRDDNNKDNNGKVNEQKKQSKPGKESAEDASFNKESLEDSGLHNSDIRCHHYHHYHHHHHNCPHIHDYQHQHHHQQQGMMQCKESSKGNSTTAEVAAAASVRAGATGPAGAANVAGSEEAVNVCHSCCCCVECYKPGPPVCFADAPAVPAADAAAAGVVYKDPCAAGFTGETYYDFAAEYDQCHPITIVHFNDVYNIQVESGNGGISRFINALSQFSDCNPLILFSGDAFNPSFISTYTQGRHMVSFLNMLKIHTACVGNHDLDFGVDHLEYLMGSTRFVWLLSNIYDADATDRPLAGASLYRLFEWQGHRVGIIGLVEHEWVKSLAQVNDEDIVYEDYVAAANKLSAILRSKECSLVIALTHMKAFNDERLAREAADIDLILGGHDHEYYGVSRIGKSIVCKSGSDFREFTALTIYPGESQSSKLPLKHVDYDKLPQGCLAPGNRAGGAYIMPQFCGGSVVEWQCIEVNQSTFPSNIHVDALVHKYISRLDRHLDKILGHNRVYLDTRFGVIRTQETNCGNWLADLMKFNTKADVACLNSGTVRSDTVFQPGLLRVRDLLTMLPMPDELVVVDASGRVLRQMLEVSVSQYPKTEGRFLQISGFRFSFDPSKPPMHRVASIDLQSFEASSGQFVYHPLNEESNLHICTKAYLADGKDGYDILKHVPVVTDPDCCPNLPTMVQNSFSLAAMASGLRKARSISTSRKVNSFKCLPEEQQKKICGMTMENGIWKLDCAIEGRIINLASRTGATETGATGTGATGTTGTGATETGATETGATVTGAPGNSMEAKVPVGVQ